MTALATIKCPFCEGSTNNNRKTLYIYSTDTYWCARCKAYGLVTELSPELLQGLTPSVKTQPLVVNIEYNNQGSRFSVCRQRYSDSTKDVFQIKLADGSLVGHFQRNLNGGIKNHVGGVKAFCYREQFLQLGSTYRLVEGVYDCVYPNDVAVLGYPTEYQAKQLKWFAKLGGLILCPDGDVWTNKDNIKKWLYPFRYFKNTVVEYIPKSLDPDECPQDQRKQIEFQEILKWLAER
jgi:hypothetical protein